MDKMINTLLADTSFGPGDVTYLTQVACTKSTYRAPSAPDKPIFLKDLGKTTLCGSLLVYHV